LIVGILVIADVALINDKIMPLLNQISFGSGMNLGTTANSLTIMMIVFGVIICVIAGLGACGACCENRLLLIIVSRERERERERETERERERDREREREREL